MNVRPIPNAPPIIKAILLKDGHGGGLRIEDWGNSEDLETGRI